MTELEGIPEGLHDVVKKYGRPMFALVNNAGMATQALGVLNALAGKHRSQHAAHAVAVLAAAFNQNSGDYVKLRGWDEGTLAQCDRDLQLAYRAMVVRPGSAILLPH